MYNNMTLYIYIHRYITLHYITLHTLHYITSHHITLHTRPLHTRPYHTIPDHTIPYHIMINHQMLVPYCDFETNLVPSVGCHHFEAIALRTCCHFGGPKRDGTTKWDHKSYSEKPSAKAKTLRP